MDSANTTTSLGPLLKEKYSDNKKQKKIRFKSLVDKLKTIKK